MVISKNECIIINKRIDTGLSRLDDLKDRVEFDNRLGSSAKKYFIDKIDDLKESLEDLRC